MSNDDSNEQIRFDVEALLGVAPKFAQAGAWIDNAVREATNDLLDLGDFWGNDKAGRAFGEAYLDQQDAVLKIIGMLSGELEGISEGLRSLAHLYRVTEDNLDRRIRRINNQG